MSQFVKRAISNRIKTLVENKLTQNLSISYVFGVRNTLENIKEYDVVLHNSIHNNGEFNTNASLENFYENDYTPSKNMLVAFHILNSGGKIRFVFDRKEICIINNIVHIKKRGTVYLEWCFVMSFTNIYYDNIHMKDNFLIIDFQKIDNDLNIEHTIYDVWDKINMFDTNANSKSYNRIWSENWKYVYGKNLNILVDIFKQVTKEDIVNNIKDTMEFNNHGTTDCHKYNTIFNNTRRRR